MNFRALLFCFAIAAMTQIAPADAKNFRWASQGDAATLDPHAFNEGYNNKANNLVYEYLAERDKAVYEKFVPRLAVSWTNPSPLTWIFKLREGVKFHDGTPFTADDVVYSFNRAGEMINGAGAFVLYANQSGVPRKIDDTTVEFTTAIPNPVMLDTVTTIMIMSKTWCEKNRVAHHQDFRNKEETFAVRNAMGTGPFRLIVWEPGVKMLHKKNPDWWGAKETLFDGNVDMVEYRPIHNAATRMAALKSGEIDFVLDPPVQDIARLRNDPDIKVWEGSENRIIYLGFDQARDELLYSDVKGKNPFKDRRVRLALYLAIDIHAIQKQVMRGLSVPTGIPLPAGTGAGIPQAMEKRHPFDPVAAKKLLADAGYGGGFGFTLTCPNDRYINDEKICVALAAMWARIGINVRVEPMPKAAFFPKIGRLEVSAYLHGWGGGASDAIFMLKPVLHSRQASGAGSSNFGNFKNEELDALIDKAEGELNMAERQGLINRAIRLLQEEIHVIPLHRQVTPWASRKNVFVVHQPNNTLEIMWVTIC